MARGLFAGSLPCGIGCDVAGIVDAIGDDVTGVEIGEAVFGTAGWANSASASASEKAVMDRWFPIAAGLDFAHAAALPMTVETAYLHLQLLGLDEARPIGLGPGSEVGSAARLDEPSDGLQTIVFIGA